MTKPSELAQQAADLYLSLDNRSRAGRALNTVAWAYLRMGRNEEVSQIARTTLLIGEQTGDNLVKGESLNLLSIVEKDLNVSIKLQKQAQQPFEAAGYVAKIASIASNIGHTYSNLGLYARAIRFYRRSLDLLPAFEYPLSNMAHIEVEVHDLERARQHVTEARSITKGKAILAFIEELEGRIALLEGNSKAGIKYFTNAIRISQDAEPVREIGQLALLGQAYLAQGNVAAALKATSRAVKKHRALGFPLIDDHPSQNIWWRHALVLRANGEKAEARVALKMAYDFLLQGIASLQDVGLRRNYLNKVATNREIIQAWIKEYARRKLPDERRFAHLAAESNIREPFQRLAEISLELNTLHTVQEIQTFLVEEATELSGGERVMLIIEKDGEFSVAGFLLPRGEDATRVLASIRKYLGKARLARTVQLIPSKRAQAALPGGGLNRVVAPLIAQNQILGYLYVDMDSLYGTFDETDRDLLGMLANQGAVALDNAQWAHGLEQKVQERTEELQTSNANLEQRNAELQVINSIQQGLAAELDFQAIVDLVGDKLREVFKAANLVINWYDHQANLRHFLYVYEKGQRLTAPPVKSNASSRENFFTTGKPFVVNSIAESKERRNPRGGWVQTLENRCFMLLFLAVTKHSA